MELTGSNNDSSDGDLVNDTILTGSTSGQDQTRTGVSSDKFVRIGSDEWICRSIDTTGYTNLTLSYYWKGDSDAESSDIGYVEYKSSGSCSDVNSSWANVQYQLNKTSWGAKQTISLPSSFDNSSFLLRFRSKSNPFQANEHFRIDDVVISSNIPASS